MQGVLQGAGFLVLWTLLLLVGGLSLLPNDPNFAITLNVQCIRNSMTLKQECPVCRKSANEGQLRPIVALEEAIESWKAARCVIPRQNGSDLYTYEGHFVCRALVLSLAVAGGDPSGSFPEGSADTVAGPSTPSKRRKLSPKDGEGQTGVPWDFHAYLPLSVQRA